MSLGLLRMASVRPAAHASPVLTLLPARGGRATVGAAPVAWVAVPLVLAGCFPSYRWTSDTGRACFLDRPSAPRRGPCCPAERGTIPGWRWTARCCALDRSCTGALVVRSSNPRPATGSVQVGSRENRKGF